MSRSLHHPEVSSLTIRFDNDTTVDYEIDVAKFRMVLNPNERPYGVITFVPKEDSSGNSR